MMRVLADGRVQSFAARGKLRNSDKLPALIKISALLTEADFYRRLAVNAIAVPIGDVVYRGRGRNRTASIDAAEVLGLGRQPWIVTFAAGKKNKPDSGK